MEASEGKNRIQSRLHSRKKLGAVLPGVTVVALGALVVGCTWDPGVTMAGETAGSPWPQARRATRLAEVRAAFCQSGPDMAVKVDLSQSDLAAPLAYGVGVSIRSGANQKFKVFPVVLETQSVVDGSVQVLANLGTSDRQSIIVETADGVTGTFWHVVGQNWTGGECRFYSERI